MLEIYERLRRQASRRCAGIDHLHQDLPRESAAGIVVLEGRKEGLRPFDGDGQRRIKLQFHEERLQEELTFFRIARFGSSSQLIQRFLRQHFPLERPIPTSPTLT